MPPDPGVNVSPFRLSLLAGAVFAVVGLLAAFVVTRLGVFTILYGGAGFPTREFPLIIALETGVLGGVSWWLLVERAREVTRERGALVGLLTGLLVHPVTWVVLLVLQNVQAGRGPFQGGLSAAFLFLYWGLGLVGMFTIIAGVGGSLLTIILRERLTGAAVAGRGLLSLGAIAVISGWLTVALALLVGVFVPILIGGGALAAGVTLVSLRWLPVVRTLLHRCYRLEPGGNTAGSKSSFRRRHAIAAVVGVVGFGLGAVGYLTFHSYFCYTVLDALLDVPIGSIYYCRWEHRSTLYPVVFVVVGVPVLLVVNRLVNRFAPTRSLRRAAAEWVVYLALVSACYTVAMAVLWL